MTTNPDIKAGRIFLHALLESPARERKIVSIAGYGMVTVGKEGVTFDAKAVRYAQLALQQYEILGKTQDRREEYLREQNLMLRYPVGNAQRDAMKNKLAQQKESDNE
jgi:serine/threonine-protein kinase RIO1|tara:strand:+ start:993 stop:1313 length:321 start_codon:yes stop_codon:yes gene_type:complete